MTSLCGLRVLDLSRFIAGPYCSMMLGDMGADVVKIEPPEEGEFARRIEPSVEGVSLYAFVVNRNKRSLALDLRSPEGLATLRELIAQADVLVENFRPGVMEQMGLGWETVRALNPRLVMARISGGPPTMVGAYVCDYSTGMYAALGILAALNARHKTGVGQLVDVSLLESGMSFLMTAIPQSRLAQTTMHRNGSQDRMTAPSNVFTSQDARHIFLVAGDDNMFPRLLRAMGRSDLGTDPRFSSMTNRFRFRDEIEQIVSDWTGSFTADDLVVRLESEGVPCAKIATVDEVMQSEQVRHRGAIHELTFGDSRIPMQGVTIHLSGTPLEIKSPIPRVGEHSVEVLQQWLGRGRERFDALRQAGAV